MSRAFFEKDEDYEKSSFLTEVYQTKKYLVNLKKTKARLEKEIKALLVERDACCECLNRQDNDARRVVWDYEEIKRQWKSLKNLETHFISEPPVISETKK
ncbi:MAG: hypothetical protein HQM08_29175, partial [Candidatus Riflebacteria bacterium]|nr:hypothetical protein [Candidatus Riflebacteria bacterium]